MSLTYIINAGVFCLTKVELSKINNMHEAEDECYIAEMKFQQYNLKHEHQ